MDEEQDSSEELREGMLSSLGSRVAAQLSIEALRESMLASLRRCMDAVHQRDGTEDFNPMEAELAEQARQSTDANYRMRDRRFIEIVTVSMGERKRQIRNARALDRFADTAKGEEFWR